MCYLFGAFNDGKEQEKAFKALNSVLKNYRFSSINYHFEAVLINGDENNRAFSNYLIDFFDDIYCNLTETNYYSLDIVYREFNNIRKQALKDKVELSFEYVNDYLATKRFIVREGNEYLFETVKPYYAEYSQEDFELMQDLFEKAREITLSTSKKIIATIDYEKKKNRCYYEWLAPTDPVNFVLGNKVGCCARINGVGHGILSESIINPNVCNLALFGRKNKIIGKATAYFNTAKKYILFNTAEISESINDDEKEELLEALIRAVNAQVEIQNQDRLNVEKVAIGMNHNDLEKQILKKHLTIVRTLLLKNNSNYWDSNYFYYGDANNCFKGQCILWNANKKRRKFLK